MTDEEFIEKYCPIVNPKEGNYYFETYGVDLEFVKSQPKNHIWAMIETDGNLYVVNNYYYANRLCYLLTENPHNETDNIEYLWSEDMDKYIEEAMGLVTTGKGDMLEQFELLQNNQGFIPNKVYVTSNFERWSCEDLVEFVEQIAEKLKEIDGN